MKVVSNLFPIRNRLNICFTNEEITLCSMLLFPTPCFLFCFCIRRELAPGIVPNIIICFTHHRYLAFSFPFCPVDLVTGQIHAHSDQNHAWNIVLQNKHCKTQDTNTIHYTNNTNTTAHHGLTRFVGFHAEGTSTDIFQSQTRAFLRC